MGENISSFPYPDIPSRIKDARKQICWFAKHFWDEAEDLSVFNPAELEQAVADYLTVLEDLPASKVKVPVRRFVRRVRPVEQLLPLLDKYLYDVDSPLRDDDLYAYIISKMSFIGSEELLHQISSNKPGTPAPDFIMTDSSGRTFCLYDCLPGKHHTLLFFYDDSCNHCMETVSEIKSSAELAYLSALGAIRLVCVDISDGAMPVSFPAYCTDATLADEDFFNEAKYFFRSMPSFFLIDSGGLILLKETTLNEALNHCSELQNIKLH